jgi:hypothetical protein
MITLTFRQSNPYITPQLDGLKIPAVNLRFAGKQTFYTEVSNMNPWWLVWLFGRGNISVAPGGRVQEKNFTVTATYTETTVTTPDGTIYVNQQRKSGKGPDTYKAYMQKVKSAPKVQGPGWAAN